MSAQLKAFRRHNKCFTWVWIWLVILTAMKSSWLQAHVTVLTADDPARPLIIKAALIVAYFMQPEI